MTEEAHNSDKSLLVHLVNLAMDASEAMKDMEIQEWRVEKRLGDKGFKLIAARVIDEADMPWITLQVFDPSIVRRYATIRDEYGEDIEQPLEYDFKVPEFMLNGKREISTE